MTSRLAWWVLLCAGACGRAASNPSPDAGLDQALPDIPAAEMSVHPGCAAELTGSAPFAMRLSGDGSFRAAYGSTFSLWPKTRTVLGDVYFPTGRRVGGTVILTMPDPAGAASVLVSAEVPLADDLSATGLSISGSGLHVTAELRPGAGGVWAEVMMNFASPGTDIADDGQAMVLLCPSTTASLPITDPSDLVAPLDAIVLESSVPLAEATLSSLTVTAGNGPVPVNVKGVSGRTSYTVSPVAAFPPNQALTIDLSKVSDVIGRPLQPIADAMNVLGTTEVLVDLALTNPVAGNGQIAGFSYTSGLGFISFGGTLDSGYFANQIVVGLPDAAATKLRVRATMTGPAGATSCTGPASLAVVGQTGARSDIVSLTCSAVDIQYDVDLQGVAPSRWLVVRAPGAGASPYSLPPPPSSTVTIHGLEYL